MYCKLAGYGFRFIIVNMNLQTVFLKLPHSQWKKSGVLKQAHCQQQAYTRKNHTIYHKRSSPLKS